MASSYEYRIEPALTDRSACRECGHLIKKGALRFGKESGASRWFHLACAKAGAPRSFKPFAEEAATLLQNAPPPQEQKQSFGRDPAIEALLADDPRDPAARAVFADQLQERGDPWGEIIRLAQSGKKKKAKDLIKAHCDDLMGGLPPKAFKWDKGFVTSVALDGRKPEAFLDLVHKLMDLRISVVIDELMIPVVADRALAEGISQRAPQSLREIFTWYSQALDYLALPSLHKLMMYVPPAPVVAPAFLSGKTLPGLRVLSMFSNDNPLPTDFLVALLDSQIIKQLEELKLFQGSLDTAGARLMKEQAHKLAHLDLTTS